MDFKWTVCVFFAPSFASSCAEQTNLPEWQYRTFPGVAISARDIVAVRRVLRATLLWTHTHTHIPLTYLSLQDPEGRFMSHGVRCFKSLAFNLSADFLAVACTPTATQLHLGSRRFPADCYCNKSHVQWLCFTVDSTLMRRSFRRWRLSEEAAMHK